MKTPAIFPIRIFCLGFVLVLMTCACQTGPQSGLSLAISLEGSGGDTIRFYQTEALLSKQIKYRELVLDERGSGKIELDYPAHSFFRMQVGEANIPLVMIHGGRLKVKGEAADLPGSLAYSGKASLPNRYLLAKDAILQKYNRMDGRFFFQLDSVGFRDRIDAFNGELDSLNGWLARQGVDQELESLLMLESRQHALGYRLNYSLVKGYNLEQCSLDITFDKTLFDARSPAYHMVLAFYYDYRIAREAWDNAVVGDRDSLANVFPEILADAVNARDIPDFAREYYIACMLKREYLKNRIGPVTARVYHRWLDKYPKSEFRSEVAEVRNTMYTLQRGATAPVIEGVDPSGKEFSSEQLLGKVLYIDVWATWCGPCVKKIPKMYALQEALKDQPGIQVLFVSVDKDLDKWKRYVSELQEGGLHINAYHTSLWDDYMMFGVPYYIIIDANGKVFQCRAPAPDSREIMDLLEEARAQ